MRTLTLFVLLLAIGWAVAEDIQMGEGSGIIEIEAGSSGGNEPLPDMESAVLTTSGTMSTSGTDSTSGTVSTASGIDSIAGTSGTMQIPTDTPLCDRMKTLSWKHSAFLIPPTYNSTRILFYNLFPTTTIGDVKVVWTDIGGQGKQQI
jgi:hypothetical protein